MQIDKIKKTRGSWIMKKYKVMFEISNKDKDYIFIYFIYSDDQDKALDIGRNKLGCVKILQEKCYEL